MQRAEMTAAVWPGCFAPQAHRGERARRRWSAAERAARQLYARWPGAGALCLCADRAVARWADRDGERRCARHFGAAGALSSASLPGFGRCRWGVRTAPADDPRLTVRLASGPSPARVVIDPRGRLPDEAALLGDDGVRRVVVQAGGRARGVEVVTLLASGGGSVRPRSAALPSAGLGRLMIEGAGSRSRISRRRVCSTGCMWGSRR